MHDHEDCMIVPEVWITPYSSTGGVRVVAQQGFISSSGKGEQQGEINRDMLNYVRGVNNIWWCIVVSMSCCPCSDK